MGNLIEVLKLLENTGRLLHGQVTYSHLCLVSFPETETRLQAPENFWMCLCLVVRGAAHCEFLLGPGDSCLLSNKREVSCACSGLVNSSGRRDLGGRVPGAERPPVPSSVRDLGSGPSSEDSVKSDCSDSS